MSQGIELSPSKGKGSGKRNRYHASIKCGSPLYARYFFFNAERGWGKDIRKELSYTDYLVARLLCSEKNVRNGTRTTLRVLNQSLDKFIRPIIRLLLGLESEADEEDEASLLYKIV